MTPTAVRVRIAVAVDETGAWVAAGWTHPDGTSLGDEELLETAINGGLEGVNLAMYWIEADLRLPQATLVPATVKLIP